MCVLFTMVFTMMCVFFRCSNMFGQSIDFERTCLRVCAIYLILSADLLNEWGLWSSTSLYQGLDENYRWIRNHSPYVLHLHYCSNFNQLHRPISLSQANHYYLVDKILLSPRQPCLLSQPTHPRYPPVNSNGWFEHICHKTSLSIYLLPVYVST